MLIGIRLNICSYDNNNMHSGNMQAVSDPAFIIKGEETQGFKSVITEKTFWKTPGNLYQILTAGGIKSIM